jgi:integrase
MVRGGLLQRSGFTEKSPEERANPSMALWGNPGYLAQQQRRLPSHKYRRLHLNLPGLPEGSAFQPEPIADAIDRGVKLRERLHGIATIGYFTGWRREEITGLEWRNVDRRAGELRIDTSKNGEGRTVPYSDVPELKAAIDAQWAVHKALVGKGTINPWVFPGRGTNRVRSFRKAWKAATKAAGCPGRLFHDFRRTAVRNLTRAGVARPIAMAITGHKTEAVFRRYDIVDSRDRREAMRKIAGVTLGTSAAQDLQISSIRAASSVVEHLTFNQGVPGSIPGRPTNR